MPHIHWAKIAYETYREVAKDKMGIILPSFDDLSSVHQECWWDVVNALKGKYESRPEM
jgi:hypothetical protein